MWLANATCHRRREARPVPTSFGADDHALETLRHFRLPVQADRLVGVARTSILEAPVDPTFFGVHEVKIAGTRSNSPVVVAVPLAAQTDRHSFPSQTVAFLRFFRLFENRAFQPGPVRDDVTTIATTTSENAGKYLGDLLKAGRVRSRPRRKSRSGRSEGPRLEDSRIEFEISSQNQDENESGPSRAPIAAPEP
jgi:hypothetical protein